MEKWKKKNQKILNPCSKKIGYYEQPRKVKKVLQKKYQVTMNDSFFLEYNQHMNRREKKERIGTFWDKDKKFFFHN